MLIRRQFFQRMLKRKWKQLMKSSKDIDPTSSSPPKNCTKSNNTEAQETFPQFQLLSEDLQITIISFIADAPFEESDAQISSALTQVLPFVSKQFYNITRTDLLWKQALLRNLNREIFLWEPGILRYLQKCVTDKERKESSDNDSKKMSPTSSHLKSDENVENEAEDISSTLEKTDNESSSKVAAKESIKVAEHGEDDYENKLVNQACELYNSLSSSESSSSPSVTHDAALHVYRSIVENYIRYTGPIFHMPNHIRLGQEFGLHFFEPRYRLLIAEVMEGWPSAQRGGPITADSNGNFPSFIYAYHNDLDPKSRAMIVQVRQVHIHNGGRADVLLVPVAHVQIEQVWVRPNTGRLHMATVVRLGKDESTKIEETAARRFHSSHRGLHADDGWDWDDREIEVGGVRGSIASVIAYLIAGHENRHFESNSDDE